jgi:hypothetical protein
MKQEAAHGAEREQQSNWLMWLLYMSLMTWVVMRIPVNGADRPDKHMEEVLAAKPAIQLVCSTSKCNVSYRNSIWIHCIVLIASTPLHLKKHMTMPLLECNEASALMLKQWSAQLSLNMQFYIH